METTATTTETKKTAAKPVAAQPKEVEKPVQKPAEPSVQTVRNPKEVSLISVTEAASALRLSSILRSSAIKYFQHEGLHTEAEWRKIFVDNKLV